MAAGFPAPAVYLDTNTFIYAFEAGNRWGDLLRPLFRQIEDTRVIAFTSELTLAEVLVRPYATEATSLISLFESVLSGDDKIRVLPVDREILRASARLRSQSSLKLADSIHVATAMAAATPWFVSNDVRLLRLLPPGISGMPVEKIPHL